MSESEESDLLQAERLSVLLWRDSGFGATVQAALSCAPSEAHRQHFWSFFLCRLSGAMTADVGKEQALAILSFAIKTIAAVDLDQAEADAAKAQGKQH